MPRKVRPYGSGDDIEAAALARSRRNPSPGYVNELAATMTIGEVATQAVEAVRALPRLCEQLARFLVVQREDGQIPRGTGGDPDGVLVVSEALSAAGRAADMMAAALAEAGAKAADLDLPSR